MEPRLVIGVLGFLAASSWISAPTRAAGLPPSEDMAKARLNGSPRHAELATVDVRGAPVRVWVVYPERKDAAPAVIVIHEIFGLTAKGPAGGGTEAYPSRDDVTKAVSGLAREEVIARLNAVREWALARPAANGKSASIGFCWGGSTSFAWAVAQPGLDAAVVYYGTAPDDLSTLATVKAPVLGLYGGSDARIDATIAATEAKMKELGKIYEPHLFEGAGHGFLRAQDAQSGANLRATEGAWPVTIAFLRQHTK